MASGYQIGALSALIGGESGALSDLFTQDKKQKSAPIWVPPAVARPVPEPVVYAVATKRKRTKVGRGGVPSAVLNKRPKVVPAVSDDEDLDEDHVGGFAGPSLKSRVREEDAKKRQSDPEKDARSLFVGNLPVATTKKELVKLFAPHGQVESARIRCAARPDLKTTKKVAVIKGKYHEKRNNINGFVVFTQVDQAKAALVLNGTVFKDFTLRVDLAVRQEHDTRKSVFVGNLNFTAEEEDLRQHFSDCGTIVDVRLIRDASTGIGKGIGYVGFSTADAVEVALRKNHTQLAQRSIRVSRCVKKSKVSVPVISNNRKKVKEGDKWKKPIVKKTTRKKLREMKDTEFQGKTAVSKRDLRAKKTVKPTRNDKKKKVIAGKLMRT